MELASRSPALLAAYALWVAFLVSWAVAGAWTERTQATPGRGREWPYLLLNVVGWAGMFYPPGSQLSPPLWRNPFPLEWVFVALIGSGIGMCWWARLHLGRMWSGNVTRKQDHRVVDTGPYRLVRHPIYTGIILAGVGMAGVSTTALALVGLVLSTAGFWIKARLEERFLIAELGDAYVRYRARTPMLVPSLAPRSREEPVQAAALSGSERAREGRDGAWLVAILLGLAVLLLAASAGLHALQAPRWAELAAWIGGCGAFALFTLMRIVGMIRASGDERRRREKQSAAAADALKRERD